jgi:ABC-type ATPase with predicted acetyltransferase domain
MESASKNDWLVSQSLERSLDVISCINRVSIHSKLRSAGLGDTATQEELDAAREALVVFLKTLSDLIQRAAGTEDKIAFGADPRLSSLARKFLSQAAQGAGAVVCQLEHLNALRALLEKDDVANDKVLIEELAHLRAILEQHAQADAAIVFNEV